MTKDKYFARFCVVSFFLSWTLLIGACSRNRVTPAQADNPTANSQSSPTPAQADKASANSQNSPTPVQPDKSVSSPQENAAAAQSDANTALDDCSKNGKLLEWQKTMKQDQFYLYAVKLFNKPAACKGKFEGDIEESGNSVMILTFSNGATYSVETFPPESSMEKLRAPDGFPDEKEARSFMKRYSEERGVHIDWSKQEENHEGDEQSFTFWDPDDGLNAGVDLVYKNRKLVEISFHMAL